MLKSDLVETDKHSIKILLRRKNLRFLSRTNHYTNTLGRIQLKLTKVATPLMHSRSHPFGNPSQRPAKPNCPSGRRARQLSAVTAFSRSLAAILKTDTA